MTTSTPEARLIDEESALCELFFSKRNIDAAVQLAATPPFPMPQRKTRRRSCRVGKPIYG